MDASKQSAQNHVSRNMFQNLSNESSSQPEILTMETEEETPITSALDREATQFRNQDSLPSETKRKAKPPPNLIGNKELKFLVKLLADNKVGKNVFYIKELDKENITLFTAIIELFNNVKEILTTNNIYYCTYTPKHLKPKNLVLKGVRGDYTADEINSEINELRD